MNENWQFIIAFTANSFDMTKKRTTAVVKPTIFVAFPKAEAHGVEFTVAKSSKFTLKDET